MGNINVVDISNYKKLSLILIIVEIIFLLAVSIGTYVYITANAGNVVELLIIPVQIFSPVMSIFLIWGVILVIKNKISIIEIMMNEKIELSKSFKAAGSYLVLAFPINLIILFSFGKVYWIIPLNAVMASPFIVISLFFAIRFYTQTDRF